MMQLRFIQAAPLIMILKAAGPPGRIPELQSDEKIVRAGHSPRLRPAHTINIILLILCKDRLLTLR